MRNVIATDKFRQSGSAREALVRNLYDFAVKGLVPMFYRGQVCERIS